MNIKTKVKNILSKKNYVLLKYDYINKMKRDFKKVLGYPLNLESPKTFNEKIQWLKVNYRDPILTAYTDKFKVRELVKEKIGSKYLIEQYGVYKEVDEININSLPEQFVLKPNNGAGKVIICSDKRNHNWEKEFKKIKKWLKENYYYVNGEWQYKDIDPVIICEKLLQEDIIDYKIFCFNGIPKFIQVISNREGSNYHSNYYDLDWNLMDIDRIDHGQSQTDIKKPECLKEMLDISERLSDIFPFVRVDLYEINGKVYFGETTFTPSNGLIKFHPEKYDEVFGEYLKLPC